MSNSAKFWDRISERYSKSPISDLETYQKKLQVTREYFTPDSEVLEIGCGTGSTAILHAPYVKRIRAIDISGKMIEIAQGKLVTENIDNVTFEQLAIDELKVDNQSYDAVLALSILHLVDDRDEVITDIYKMLKPGGVFVSSTVCLGDSMLKFIKLVEPIGKLLGLMPAVEAFTSAEYEVSIKKAGFEIEHRWFPDKMKALFLVARKPG